MRGLAFAFCLLPTVLFAAPDLDVPGGQIVGQDFRAAARLPMPQRPWEADHTTREIDGPTTRVAWEVVQNRSTPLQLVNALRDALVADGYTIRFECEAIGCGGFDFRFSLDLLPPPAMFVDLGIYHYLTASSAGSEIAILASRTAESGFVHITIVGEDAELMQPPDPEEEELAMPAPEVEIVEVTPSVQVSVTEATPGSLGAELTTIGRVALDDLRFASGSTNLAEGTSEHLSALADWMRANPDSRIALVGHTDAVGSLEGNTRLARARAQAVADQLTGALGIAANRIEAQGAGYLSPRAPNTTEEGRALNRRVEAVLLDTE